MTKTSTEKYALMKHIKMARAYKNIYIFGLGYNGEYLVRGFLANEIKITSILDNNNGAVGRKLLEIPITSPIEMNTDEDTYVLISNQDEYNRKAIIDQLLLLGLKENQISVYNQIVPSELKKMPDDEKKALMRDVCEFQFGVNLYGKEV